MSIYKKLMIVKSSVTYIKKDKKGHQYNYASPSQVLGTINPLLIEQGIILKTEVVDCHTERIFAKPKAYDVWVNKVNTPQVHEVHETMFTLKMKMTWVDIETGETDVNEWYSSGVNGDEKGLGSALTYAERYFMLKYFNIPTDEDDPDSFQTKYMTDEQKQEIAAKQEAELKAQQEAEQKRIKLIYDKAVNELNSITDTSMFTQLKETYKELMPVSVSDFKSLMLAKFEEVKLEQSKAEANPAGILKKQDEVQDVQEIKSLTQSHIDLIETYTDKRSLSTWALKTVKVLTSSGESEEEIKRFKDLVNEKVSKL